MTQPIESGWGNPDGHKPSTLDRSRHMRPELESPETVTAAEAEAAGVAVGHALIEATGSILDRVRKIVDEALESERTKDWIIALADLDRVLKELGK